MAPSSGRRPAPRVGRSSGVSQAAHARREQDSEQAVRKRPDDGSAAVQARLAVRGGLVADLDPLGIAPQPLERVELARLRREDVDDEVEVVHQDPLGAVVALDVRRPHLRGAQRLLDGVGDRLHLPRVLSGAQHEEVGERRRVAQVEHDDVERLLVERRADRLRDLAGQSFLARADARRSVFAMQVICRGVNQS